MARKAIAKTSFDAGFKVEVTVKPSTDENEELQISKSEDSKDFKFTISQTFVSKSFNDEKREVVCVAMVANEIDAHGDMFTPEAVEYAAHNFLPKYNLTKDIGRDHSGELPDVDLIGSWYTEQGGNFDGLDAPKHSWIAKMKVNDDNTWADVKSGHITGFSIEGDAWGYVPTNETEQTSLAKSADSESVTETDKPKRIITKADPSKIDLVNQGANLHTLIWKSSNIRMAKQNETPELVNVEVSKSQTPQAENGVEVPAVEGGVTKGKTMTDKRKAKLKAAMDILSELGLEVEVDTLEAEPVGELKKAAEKPEKVEAPQPSDADKMAEAIAKALQPFADTQLKLVKALAEIEEARGVSAVSEEPVTPPAEDNTSRPFGGLMKGIQFGKA